MTYPCHWFSEQVGLAGDMGSTNDVLIPLVVHDKEFKQNLVQPFKNPERVFRSSRKLSKTRSLDYLSSSEFNLISDPKDQFEEEETETMTEPTMEEYMTKTRDGYGLDNEDADEHIEKVLEIERFKELLLRCPQHYLTDMQEVISFYKGLDVPTRQILDSKGVIPSMKAADANKAIQDMVDHSQKWHNGTSTRCRSTETSDGLAAIQAQLNNLGREIKKVNEKVYDAQGSYELKDFDAYSIGTTLLDDALPPKEKDPRSFTLPCIINNLCFNKALADLGASNRDLKGIAENVLVGIDKFVFPVYFIVLDMLEDIKTPLILGRPFLSTAHAKIDVFKRKITLRVGNDKVMFKSDKPTSNIIKRVHALSLRERIELDLKDRLIGEALILNRSLDPLYEDYIKLNDLNEPLELSRNQVDDLEPTIKEGEVVDEPMKDIVKTRCDNVIITGLDFVVVKNIDSYRDEGMGDIIIGRPFCKDACIKAIGFDGMITIYKGNNSVTYQMARSHLRFKHLTNVQCSKMRSLLKVSVQDELKGISHPYQKLKGFYKEVLNLGPE
ncbi:gag-pol polyprotein [Tanacetum coccineum]|uniref:Gag-pol polyprotein n=1 Tax=Tanacetum coccineum TaxID=301880 RepID=A0ABQ5AX60_9ASTR